MYNAEGDAWGAHPAHGTHRAYGIFLQIYRHATRILVRCLRPQICFHVHSMQQDYRFTCTHATRQVSQIWRLTCLLFPFKKE
jgi:hypothetical protein